MNDTLILIPAYQPTNELVDLSAALFSSGFRLLIVDDGSSDEYTDTFERLCAYATVVGYDEKKGIGNAIKYGLDVVAEQMSYFKYLVISDADSCNSMDMIVKVAEKLHESESIVVATERHSKQSKKAFIFNAVMRPIFALTTGIYLRSLVLDVCGFGMNYLSRLMKATGDTYDYEMSILLEAAKTRYPICEISVDDCCQHTGAHRKKAKHKQYDVLNDGIIQIKELIKSAIPSLCAMILNYAIILIGIAVFGRDYASIAGSVMLGSGLGIVASVHANNRIGYEDNVDGVLSYNRILMGLLRFFVYFLFMELFCGFAGVSSTLSLIITVAVSVFIEVFIMREKLDRNLRLRVEAVNPEQ